MRILHIHNYYRLPGGEDASSDAEVAMLRRAGHDVRTIRAHNPDRTVPALTALAASPSNPAQARAMRQKVREWRPDVAHLHNTWFVLTPAIVHALHRESVPIVMTLHNYRLVCVSANLLRDGRVCTDCVGTHPWWGAMHRCYRDSLPASMLAATTIAFNRARRTWDLVDRFVAPSGFVRDLFIEAGFRHDRLVVKPNVANDPGPRPRKPSASRTVLFAGRLSREKGVGTLLDAWFRASLDLELVVAGDGPLRVELERAAPPGVRFEGWVELPPVDGNDAGREGAPLPF